MSKLAPRTALFAVALLCLASVAAALTAQYHFKMEPCPWCILQRMIVVLLAVLSLIAASVPQALARRTVSALALPFAASGIAAALWQHFVAAKSTSCALTLADRIITALGLDTRWPDVFEVRASCADAAVSVLGVPFEFWSLALFAIAGIVFIFSIVTPGRRA